MCQDYFVFAGCIRATASHSLFRFLLSLALSASIWQVVEADLVAIVNPGFESQTVADGSFVRGMITGWSTGADSGVFNPSAASYAAEAPEGLNVAYTGGTFTGRTISQTLSSVLMQGSYELRVEIGDRLDTAFAGYLIELLGGWDRFGDGFQFTSAG